MKVMAQGDPIEYDVRHPSEACRLYRKDMADAIIGVVTNVTDHERAQRNAESIRLMNESYQELNAAYQHVVATRETAVKEIIRLEAQRDALLTALKQAQEDTCSLHCPSVRRDDEPWTHSDRCRSIQTAIAAAEQEGTA